MTEALVQIDNLMLRAGRRLLVSGLSLQLAAGERLVLTGPNGSGKSTLLSALAGLRKPDGGRIVRPATPPGMLFQDGGLWPHFSVVQHLRFVAPRAAPDWIDRLLALFDLGHLAAARPERLSGGERVRLGLARAFAPRPAWLLLDEPFAHLDASFGALLRETLPPLLNELGAAAITVSHDADDMPLFGERLLCLSGEGGAWQGSVAAALSLPPTPVLAALSGRGTMLLGRADGDGVAALDFGLSLAGLVPGEQVTAFLAAAEVHFAEPPDGARARDSANPAGSLSGTLLAPDGRGGCWVTVQRRLLRVGQPPDSRRAGDTVAVSVRGLPRRLHAAGRAA